MENARRYYSVLGLGSDCSHAEVRAAYRRLAKRNHPDLFPDAQRSRQQLTMMRINEAYMALLARLSEDRRGPEHAAGGEPAETATSGGQSRTPPGGVDTGTFFQAWEQKAQPGAPATGSQIGALRDPAYAYYKQGFRYFNLGSTELFRKEAPTIRRHLITEGSADGYILRLALRALHYFERSYSYFLVVVDQYPSSAWCADARWKLRRLEKFSVVYQRICENLSRRSSARRTDHSVARPAPSGAQD